MKFQLLLFTALAALAIGPPAAGDYMFGNIPGFSQPRRQNGGSFGVDSSPYGSSPFGSSSSDAFSWVRPRMQTYFFWNTEAYHKWTNWSSCRSASCRRFRYRRCRRGRKCPSLYLVEMQECTDALGCREETFNATLDSIENSTCGIRPDVNLKIMGGRPADPHSWPWQAGLIMSQKQNAVPSCGATLIGSQWVVTAAHCLVVNSWPKRLPVGRPFKPKKNSIRLRLGDHHMHIHDSYEKTLNAELIIIHPNFKLSLQSCKNDIALIKLSDEAPMHHKVNKACLPPKGMNLPSKTMCKALGWGVAGYFAPRRRSIFDWFRPKRPIRPEVLQEVDIPLISYRECMRQYPNYALTASSHLCAGAYGKDTCKGDSGGPLLCPMKIKGKERWFLYGVTSFGSRNGCGKGFGVYSKVSTFTKWIQNKKKELDDTI